MIRTLVRSLLLYSSWALFIPLIETAFFLVQSLFSPSFFLGSTISQPTKSGLVWDPSEGTQHMYEAM